MADIDLPADLIELERAAWTEIQAGALTVETALAVHQGVTEYAAREDVEASRLEVETLLKRIVRHPQPDADAA
ncbi:hypothetical protein [Streptomyces sp. NPDC050145]|uniref:hypothetical protein n=1 Tax=Streptomyces sp. NPDC050145 TaxID=3365602 RepID=UPI0037BB87EA